MIRQSLKPYILIIVVCLHVVLRVSGSAPQLPQRPGPGHPLFHYVVSGPHGIAMYDFEATQPDELPFKVNNLLHSIL